MRRPCFDPLCLDQQVTCVPYIPWGGGGGGGAQYRGGLEYRGGVQYHGGAIMINVGGYLEYCGGCSYYLFI